MRTQESKALTLRETIREVKIIAHSPCPKLHTYRGSSTGTPWWTTRTKKAGIQTKHLLSSEFSTKQSHLKAQKNQDPQSSKQKCAIQNHTDVNLTFKGLYITKKRKSQRMCKIHSMRLVSSLLGKLLFSSLFPAYCWKRDCQNNDTSSQIFKIKLVPPDPALWTCPGCRNKPSPLCLQNIFHLDPQQLELKQRADQQAAIQ